jgi:hypothetical protein
VGTTAEVDGVGEGSSEEGEVEAGTPVGEDAAAVSRFDLFPAAAMTVAIDSSGFRVSVEGAVDGAGVWARSFVSAV